MSRLVTVIPVYNGERFLEATLASVASQTRQPDRVIIQDNCSTDGTTDIARAFEKEGFELVLNSAHVSGVVNFNMAMRYANKAEMLHLLPSDDLIKPDFYDRMMAPIRSVEGRAIVYSAYEVIDEFGELVKDGDLVNPFPINPTGSPRIIERSRFIASQADLRTICLPAVLMKTCYRQLPVLMREDYIQCSDAVFYAELATYCECIIEVPAALCQYRRHPYSVTSQNKTRPAALIADEWRAMQAASAWLGKSGLSSWLWNFRQRCLLAGTSRVMLQGADEATPHYRETVVRATRDITGGCAWWLGNLAVALRDFLGHGRPRGW